jgi:hypothetical protein
MTIITRTLEFPDAKETLGPKLFPQFPAGYMLPYSCAVREAYGKCDKEVKAGHTVKTIFPNVGEVVMEPGRKYTFRPTAEYAANKGYPAEITGWW